MERQLRKPFQGVLNIIKFNWHFYVLAFLLVALLFTFASFLPSNLNLLIYFFAAAIVFGTLLSLLASFYIYDVSNLYTLTWLDDLALDDNALILNISIAATHVGFITQRSKLLFDPKREKVGLQIDTNRTQRLLNL